MKHRPTDIRLHRQARMLEMVYADGESHRLSCEFLRVYSPSAEVTGHGPGQEVLQVGKEAVTITGIEPVGNYGIKLVFSDGHDTGIYDWEYLYRLGVDQARLWQTYLERLEAAGHQRQG
ncbi:MULTISPECIES: gamma-butyrobetaine hydroxylase-like domain-containing protein [Ectothiorhodospira]|uniref:gamma-butyrobetaine hydroxylase-like domain-containing protein n=2 Tax=Ectothiorhodospiraceae TaxID=72276 RepID=UPI00024A873B|nr:DUF971 domain-containing protein [Ectothiorhodospira sp. PHS-1]EHQ51217.1 hypothetical protein ECTPHS_00914 [Ectothiorhodospira sp. PHS-1]MBK1671769.1 DUF971 domain-containing protein [Ectothiorhodospira shaposhnikovii]